MDAGGASVGQTSVASRGHGKAVTLHTLRELLGCVRTGILHEGTTGTTTVPAIVCLDRVPLRPPTPSVGRVLDMEKRSRSNRGRHRWLAGPPV